MTDAAAQRPDGIDGSALPGPFPVGVWAKGFQEFLRERPRVQLFGEVVNLRASRAKAYFELRDGDGAAQCSIWSEPARRARAAGGRTRRRRPGRRRRRPGLLPGQPHRLPRLLLRRHRLRVAGEGDLLAQLADLRRRLEAEGLFLPQKELPLTALPRTIGVITGEGGKARDDVLAGLHRRGWGGRLVWAFAPVQDRRAAAAVTAALQDLAAIEEVDVIIVARGGGSLADLFAFSDETLCRTVALLRVPVDRERRPPHRPDADRRRRGGQRVDADPRRGGRGAARHPRRAGPDAARGRRAASGTAAAPWSTAPASLARMARVPSDHVARHRRNLHQSLRELRAAAGRRSGERRAATATRALVLHRKALAGAGAEADARRRAVESLGLALDRPRPAARAGAGIRDG